MNANETTEIRELTAQELDEVNGGIFALLAFAAGCLAYGLAGGLAYGGGNHDALDYGTGT
jgi:lactobin A/cerein 7B family class IIb bacteriocin